MDKKIKVRIPTTPSFLFAGEQKFALRDFTEEELREIGKEWTEELIKKSKKQPPIFIN